MSFSICIMCGSHDSKASNGDCDWCSECYSVEQGFTYLEEHGDNQFIDEDGIVYDENLEVVPCKN